MQRTGTTRRIALTHPPLFLAACVFLLVLIPHSLTAQKITDAMNRHVLTIQPDGRILSPRNVTLGHFKSDGRIIDARNRLIGRISDEGRFHSPSNKLLGCIDNDGKVWNAQNMLLGRVEKTGRVYDSRNRLLGRGNGVPEKYLAWYWFINDLVE